jgi:dTDP-4-amino-4,6-dideoxy-D-galactose acyltransferase
MKKSMINRLNWDSDFFNLEAGELVETNEADFDTSMSALYDFIVVKQESEKPISITGFEPTFQETKVVFSKHLEQNFDTMSFDFVLDSDSNPVQNQELYPLAYESGKFSRYNLDSNFTEFQFQLLYQKWIDNSINKTFADKIFFIKDNEVVQGFVTIKKNEKQATIGLIAVSENNQGKGFGSVLIQTAEEYCISQNIFNLLIPTQKENLPATNFYSKLGYSILNQTIIKHYWKKI